MKRCFTFFIIIFAFLYADQALAADGLIPALNIKSVGDSKNYSLSLQVVILMTLLTVLPGFLMAMTAFTRIIIVLSILRQALGMASTPTNQILIGISLFLTFFVMAPVFDNINNNALQPYLQDKMDLQAALSTAQAPLKKFMLSQVRQKDVELFSRISGNDKIKHADDLPFTVIMPSFLTSELKTAFQIGFILFLPFLIIDLVVASVLMAMGMMMLSPLIISLPFKIMLFVLVDGWTLIIGSLVGSFGGA